MGRRLTTVGALVAAFTLLIAVPASADHCINLNKKPLAGAQIVFGPEGDPITGIVWMTNGLEKRAAKGLVDLVTGEGFNGLIGLMPGSIPGVDDAITIYIVGPDTGVDYPERALPHQAMERGSPDHGIVDICDHYAGLCEPPPE